MKVLLFASVLLILQTNRFQCEKLISVYINNLNTTWKASETPHHGSFMQIDEFSQPNLLLKKYPVKTYQNTIPIPDEFDARNKWPQCKSVNTIGDQGNCGSCWAYSAANSMSDRTCIATNGSVQVSLSVETLIDCCYNSYGCNGGYKEYAWLYWESGIPSEQCQPYIQQVNPVQQLCSQTCELNYTKKYENDLIYGQKIYKLNTVQDVQRDIIENGPLALSYRIYEDFLNYESGIYVHKIGKELGGHAVRVIGWGIENETAYWLIANSWGPNWGEKGFFRIRRGTNEANIEDFSRLYVANYEKPKNNDGNSSVSVLCNKGVILFAIVTCFLSIFYM